jgi:predicted dehydrogenase
VADKIRLAVVGAGSFTRGRTLPNFRKLADEVEIVAVANRSVASAEAVAKDFEIPEALDDWRPLVQRDDIDAVFIGAPPYIHKEVAAAAMAAGKDVLSQTRMSRTMEEGRDMLALAQATGRKGALVRPSRFVAGGRFIKDMLDTGYVGNVRQVWYYRLIPDYTDASTPLSGRQNVEQFGVINTLYLGYGWDALQPWFGDPKRVLAAGVTFTPERPAWAGGPMTPVPAPEAMTAIAEMESGAIVTSVQSGVAHLGEDRIEIYGDEGTIIYKPAGEQILGGRRGDKALAPLEIPEDMRDTWTVERDFIRWIRGELDEFHPNFADGAKSMEYLEACYRSNLKGGWVDMPLP